MHNTTITLESEAPVSTVGPHPQAKPHVGPVYVEWGEGVQKVAGRGGFTRIYETTYMYV